MGVLIGVSVSKWIWIESEERRETYGFWVQLNPVPEAVVVVEGGCVVVVGSGAPDEVVWGTSTEDVRGTVAEVVGGAELAVVVGGAEPAMDVAALADSDGIGAMEGGMRLDGGFEEYALIVYVG